jgi:hypothetical protein
MEIELPTLNYEKVVIKISSFLKENFNKSGLKDLLLA